MKRYLIIALLLTIGAITSTAGDNTIQADYAEEVRYNASGVLAANSRPTLAMTDAGSAADRILRTAIDLPLGNHRYLLTAGDRLGNLARHEESVLIQGPLSIKIQSPSENGMAPNARFPLSVRTDEAATCRWSFEAPGQAPFWHEMESEGGLLHTDEGFMEQRFQRTETVPVRLSCEAQDGRRSSTVAALGWGQDTPRITGSIWPMPLYDPGDKVSIELSSDEPTRCLLIGPTDNKTSGPSLQHNFDGLPQAGQGFIYRARCTDASGGTLPTLSFTVVQNFASPDIHIDTILSDAITNDNPVIIARTNRAARCEQDLGTPDKLGPLAQGREHQRLVILDEGTNTGSITCTDGTITNTAALTVTKDTSAPIIRAIETPVACDDTLIVKLREQNGDEASSVVLSVQGGGSVQRAWTGGTVEMRQHAIGASPGSMLTVRGIDEAGNIGPAQNIEIGTLADETLCPYLGFTQDLWLIQPEDGGADEEFTLAIGSELPSACSWKVGAKQGALDTSDGTTHLQAGFIEESGLTPGEYVLSATCEDGQGINTTETFPLAWDLPAPQVSARAEPSRLTDPNEPDAKIILTADQEVVCRYDEEPFNHPHYNKTQELPVSVGYGAGTRTFTLGCRNRLGAEWRGAINITEEYPSMLTLNILTPSSTRTAEVVLRVRSATRASCTAKLGQSMVTLDSQDKLDHTKSYTIPSEGTHNITYTCDELYADGNAVVASKNIVYDKTPPTVDLQSPAYTCGTKKYTVNGSGSADVKQFIITIDGKNTTTDKLPHQVSNLDLKINQTYRVELRGKDAAGNIGNADWQDVQARSAKDGSCDTTAPVAHLAQKKQNGGTKAWLICIDDSGCKDDYKLGTGAPDGACEPKPQKFSTNHSLLITTKTKVCWEVFDNNGLKTTGNAVIMGTAAPSHCTDSVKSGDETGIDCGGSCETCAEDEGTCTDGVKSGDETGVDCGGTDYSCQRCDTGIACENDFDCKSKRCQNDNRCAAPTCNDGVMNGQETDIDCGGSACGKCAEGDRCRDATDCTTGICSSNTCTSTELDRNDPGGFDDWEDQELVPEKGSSLWAIILILLGILLSGGGGGYIWFEKQHDKPLSTSIPREPSDAFSMKSPSETPSLMTPQRGPDYGQSRLREEARKKRREERAGGRRSLVDTFERPEKRPEKQSIPIANDKVKELHASFAKAQTPDALKELAREAIDSGTAEKHHVSAALSDLHAHDDVDEDALDDLRKELKL